MSRLPNISSVDRGESHAPSKWRGILRLLIRYRLPILIAMAFYRLIGLGFSEMQQGGESIVALRVQTILRFGELWDQSPHMLSGISNAMQPPLYAWFSASSVLMIGDMLWVYRLPSALAAAALAILLYRFARMSMSTVRALIVAGLFAFAPLPTFLSRQALPDLLFMCAITAAVYFSWHAMRGRSRGAMLLAGLSLGAALMTGGAFALTVPVSLAAAGLMMPPYLRRRAWGTAAAVTVVSIPLWLPWTWSMTAAHGGGDPFWILSAARSFHISAGIVETEQNAGLLTIAYRLLVLMLLLFPFALYFLWQALYERRHPLWTFVATFILCGLAAGWMTGAHSESTFLPLLPLLMYAGVHGWRLLRPTRGKLRMMLSLPTLLIYLALLSVFTMQQIWRVDPEAYDDGARRAAALLRVCDAERVLLVGNGDNPQLTWQLEGADIGWIATEELRYERLEPFALGVEAIRERAAGYADSLRVVMLVERDEIARGVYREAAEVLPPDFTLHLQTRRYIVAGSSSVRWRPDSATGRETVWTDHPTVGHSAAFIIIPQ
ncbi:MAG: hypothetical protein C0600_02650 [Ignavibacteria bacterium]|nr:MAG: hypothetical protein C0600_02650 [Ignavibacteria bacterium]